MGETLTAGVSGIDDSDRLENATFSYQWVREDGGTDTDIQGETSSTYTLTDDDEGKTVKVRVSFTDDAGNPESRTSAATETVAARPNTPATGQPTIGGTVQVGETLTAGVSGIDDSDRLENATFSYQWVREDGGTDTDIQGETSSTYTLTDDDEGKTVKVRVSFTDDAGNPESRTSAATETVAARPNTPATGQPTIGGTVQVGETLTAGVSDIDDVDGLENATFSYQWVREDGGTDTDIQGETSSTYTLTDDDEGNTVKVRVSFTDDAGNPESRTSDATTAVAARPNTPATGQPTIGGTVQVGETLTAGVSGIDDQDELNNATFSYQWVREDGGTETDIEGATDSTYTLTDDDEGNTVKVRVSFTDDAGNPESRSSDATTAVAAKPNTPATGEPTIGGTVQVGETLTAGVSDIDDQDELANATFSYQWVREDGGTETDIEDATDSAYILVAADEGKAIKVRVSFTDDAGQPGVADQRCHRGRRADSQ